MADIEEDDPYAVSSDSEDESAGKRKGPPPKIDIGANADIKQIKENLTSDKAATKDEKTLEEIAELRRLKADELSRMKKDFEQGTVVNDPDAPQPGSATVVTGLDKQTLSAFKDKFEKMDTTLEQNLEERLKNVEKSLEGVGKENLAMKGMFEGSQKEFTAEQKEELLALQRSEADRRRVLATFGQGEKANVNDDEGPRNCFICDKVVYPVEKVVASKRTYHSGCFKCSKCGKKLSSTTFNSHQGQLYCKPHMLEVLHPERAGTFAEADTEDGQIHADDDDDDDEFAVTSKPKQLGADVVRAGNTNIGDELSQLKNSLKEKKENWQSSANEAQQRAAKTQEIAEEIEAGKVKANLDKIISGGDAEAINDEEKRKQLDAIREQVSEVKNKWKTGDIENASDVHAGAANEELEELKKGPKVRDRFNERLQADEFGNENKSYDPSEVQNSGAAEARKSFLEGLAYQSGPVEKAAVADLQELKFTGLNAFKDKFERGADDEELKEKSAVELYIQLKDIKQALEKSDDNSPEARAERKKKEIEEEFLRYKLARKLQAKRQKEIEACALIQQVEEKEEIPPAEVGSIKNRFEAGEAYRSQAGEKPELDVDIKIAGKAREKFKNIEAQNPQGSAPMPKKTGAPSKWDKKVESSAEIVNKRAEQEDESDEEQEAFDVKNLMNKFKNIENMGAKQMERKLDELEALRVEAKNLRQKFEQSGGDTEEHSEEKKRQLEEEFKQLKEERERAKKELELELKESEEANQATKEEVQVAADHASKMTAKWEKIHKKEAKKAQKDQMPQK
ncbi:LIM domain-containing protein [Ditylenchus destructor]|uniref:LIM domain-containing protein n=1 Tax=Ditylenchus destructor TaxID=166010 RepID=A0AAD4N6R9_9BILA|nr:LIM domain-containing protein [Ditylenchus destructor]